ncbi:uncharacterized protein LOC119556635 isoform X2 [Drosophila subpulchrella]|uniref:uncharacterized protein LOC119556635 isoform X2 n=1 Tax=Drosophila subpulchrella TaxID=1486046 RepID=UPI0018A17AC5|nr:uncharacterized protein LOC119556635 isoform X2 [Drosophila subpulchrella]
MRAMSPLQVHHRGVLDNMATGYLRLVHQIQAHLSPSPPVLIQVEEKREVGGEIPKSPVIEDEISQSSEDGTQPRIGFVDLFRRSLQFECLGIPLTPLELFSMEAQKTKEPKGRILGGFRTGTEEGKPATTSQGGSCKGMEWASKENPSLKYDCPSTETRNCLFSEINPTPKAIGNIQNESDHLESGEDDEAFLNDEIYNQISTIELAQYAPKFRSRFLGNFPHANLTKELPKRSSSQNLAHFPFSYSALSAFGLPTKNSVAHLPSQDSVQLSDQSQDSNPIKTRRCSKFPVQSSSKILGKPNKVPKKLQPRCGFQGGNKKSSIPENYKISNCSEMPKNTCEMNFRDSNEPSCSSKSFPPKKKAINTKVNVSKMCLNSRWLPCGPEGKHHRPDPCHSCPIHGTSRSKGVPMETLLAPRNLKDCHSSGSEAIQNDNHLIGFKGRKTPDPVKSSSLEVFDKRLKALLKSEPTKSCLKKPADPVDDPNPDPDDTEQLVPLHSNDTFTEVWINTELGRGHLDHQKQCLGGLYGQADKLKYQPLDRLYAGCAGLPLFKKSDETLARTQYFVTEFDKQSRAERMQDIKLRMGQVRWLQATSDREYRKHFADHKMGFKPVLSNSVKYVCPSNNCECPTVMNATLLGHFLSQHLDESGIELREIFKDQRVLMVFSPKDFDLGQNTCVSVIVYGGVRGKPCTLPAARFMPTRNKELPEPYQHFDNHLPLFVMICRNRLSSLEGRGRRVRFEGLDDEDVLALWMVSMDLPRPVHVVMTVINRRLDITRSSIMKVRGLHKSHNCLDFMPHSQQYMRLNDHDLRVLTNDHTEPVYMEIAVKEYGGIFPCHLAH